MAAASVTQLRLTTASVIPNPNQPRRRFDQEALAELAASIKANGLIQPITVRLFRPYQPHAIVGDDRNPMPQYMIVAGERRWCAHVLAGLEAIDANLIEITDSERDILAIVENLQRADITPLEEGRAFQRVLDTGVTAQELADRLGLKQPWRITDRTARQDSAYPRSQPDPRRYTEEFSRALGLKPTPTRFGNRLLRI